LTPPSGDEQVAQDHTNNSLPLCIITMVVRGKAAYIDGIGPANPYAGMYGEWEIANPGK